MSKTAKKCSGWLLAILYLTVILFGGIAQNYLSKKSVDTTWGKRFQAKASDNLQSSVSYSKTALAKQVQNNSPQIKHFEALCNPSIYLHNNNKGPARPLSFLVFYFVQKFKTQLIYPFHYFW